MDTKHFFIWFYQLHTTHVNIKDAKEKFGDDFDSMLGQLTPFFHMSKDGLMSLKKQYKIGIIDIKKTQSFLITDEEFDYRIDLDDLNGALDKDIVLAKVDVIDPFVVTVLKSNLTQIIALVKKTKKFIRFDSEVTRDKLIIVNDIPDYLVDGHYCLLHVENQTKTTIETKFIEVIGHQNDPDMDIVKIIYEYGWHTKFSKELLKELSEIKVDDAYEKSYRRDLTNELIVTIDGADAKDLDDAISLKELDDEHVLLGVHIADVSYFVKEGSLIDQEAYQRATSVYLADRVIPMLPHALSNDLCSLNPNEEKYTLSVLMKINKNMEVVSHEIFPSVIKTSYRLTYDRVNDFLYNFKTFEDERLNQMLLKMNEISMQLKRLRYKRGAIDFHSIELGFVIKNHEVLDVYQRTSDDAEKLIESFMILTNEVISKHMYDLGYPNIYRIHEKPDLVKIDQAYQTLRVLGFHPSQKLKSQHKILQQVTEESMKTRYGSIVHTVLLRAMQKAKYYFEPIGHFGLASAYYSHFTSPIRRYPDLFLHRMIRDIIFDHKEKAINHYRQILPEVSEHTSIQERTAIQMERDVEKLMSCLYMKKYVGQVYEAIITQVMMNGFFVRTHKGIEGFVHLKNVDDYLVYHEAKMLFTSSQGEKYRLGDTIQVQLLKVDMDELKIDFTIYKKREIKSKNKSKKRK